MEDKAEKKTREKQSNQFVESRKQILQDIIEGAAGAAGIKNRTT